jgi:D-arabinose 1-dehydrogenase-like Zn-dependent alcohol dehydrogenase
MLPHIYFLPLTVIGSTMGTRDELVRLLAMLDATGARPIVDRSLPMEQAHDGFAAMLSGDVFGKIVLTL